ncbi:unnamed protein product, partial [Allacma fusca]
SSSGVSQGVSQIGVFLDSDKFVGLNEDTFSYIDRVFTFRVGTTVQKHLLQQKIVS